MGALLRRGVGEVPSPTPTHTHNKGPFSPSIKTHNPSSEMLDELCVGVCVGALGDGGGSRPHTHERDSCQLLFASSLAVLGYGCCIR